jgi:N-methylhydantoinase B
MKTKLSQRRTSQIDPARETRPDAVSLEVFKNVFTSIAEEMGAALRRTAHSPNIRDRLDFSCALFDTRCRMIAQAAHIPVHLGSMHFAVKEAFGSKPPVDSGTWIVNDPYAGGTHLPDVTLVTPVLGKRHRLLFYVASRAHHTDMGGTSGGSMGVHQSIFAEGLRIPPVQLVSGSGQWDETLLALLKANVRNPQYLEGDLLAQFSANQTGSRRLSEFLTRYGDKRMTDYAAYLLRYSTLRMRLKLASFPDGTYEGEDFLEDDGVGSESLRIHASIRIRSSRVLVDFAGTAPQTAGPVNATLPVTWSCVQYVFRTLTDSDIPNNSGCFDPIELRAPVGCLVHATFPAAVAAGNVETSQRIVDTLYRALAKALPQTIPAASAGSMNNISVSGMDPQSGEPFSYYETVGGGMGARPGRKGLSGVHTHMPNTRNTPVEVLEHVYPLRVERYALRRGSGGGGRFRGGDGLIRRVRFLSRVRIHLLGDRRHTGPYGLRGGLAGKPGRDKLLVRGTRKTRLPSKGTAVASPGDVLCVETPGGGGWGTTKTKGNG